MRLELMTRAYSDESPEAALAAGRRWSDALARGGFALDAFDAEPPGARDGSDDGYHWSFGRDEHRSRLLGAAFWGAEVTTPWGPATRSALSTALALFDSLASVEPVHRRFAVYPGHHLVSVGVHVLVPRNPASVARTVELLQAATPALTAVGVPYRGRGLFAQAISARLREGGADASRALVDAMFATFDPDHLLGSRTRGTDSR